MLAFGYPGDWPNFGRHYSWRSFLTQILGALYWSPVTHIREEGMGPKIWILKLVGLDRILDFGIWYMGLALTSAHPSRSLLWR